MTHFIHINRVQAGKMFLLFQFFLFFFLYFLYFHNLTICFNVMVSVLGCKATLVYSNETILYYKLYCTLTRCRVQNCSTRSLYKSKKKKWSKWVKLPFIAHLLRRIKLKRVDYALLRYCRHRHRAKLRNQIEKLYSCFFTTQSTNKPCIYVCVCTWMCVYVIYFDVIQQQVAQQRAKNGDYSQLPCCSYRHFSEWI